MDKTVITQIGASGEPCPVQVQTTVEANMVDGRPQPRCAACGAGLKDRSKQFCPECERSPDVI